jgi:cytoskeletal protein RodZ
VSIGGALAEAREQAGLTITEVSERTRIRETIIRGIEHDDYTACGGDFYARGHIRAIARTVGTDPAPLINEYDSTQAAPEEPAAENLESSRPIRDPVRFRAPPWQAVAALAGVLVLVLLLLFVLGSGPRPGRSADTADSAPAGHRHSTAGPHSPSASSQPSASASPSPVVLGQLLAPASAAAFGPGGPGQGDNPQLARLAIDHSVRTAWQTDWYATATFGGLKPGTGLLIDMGRPVTISAVTLSLGAVHGASLQLRTGDTTSLPGLQPRAQVTGAGGTEQLSLTSPVQARFLLIWFTKLPADPAGTFQAFLDNVAIYGSQ